MDKVIIGTSANVEAEYGYSTDQAFTIVHLFNDEPVSVEGFSTKAAALVVLEDYHGAEVGYSLGRATSILTRAKNKWAPAHFSSVQAGRYGVLYIYQQRRTTMHIVTLIHLGNTFYLRATIWTAHRDRAQEFPTREAAQAQLDKAKQFMKAAQYRAAQIMEG